jgi:hypothetical protein
MSYQKLPYNNFSAFLKEKFGAPVAKISVDAGFTCPHRGGRKKEGCIFCDERGSGNGAFARGIDVRTQITRAIRARRTRTRNGKFIVYFQAFTNTYASVPALRELYDAAVGFEDVVGLSIGTRPDCVDDAVLGLIASYAKRVMVWLELGLQSAHDTTLARINRGHRAEDFFDAVRRARKRNILLCAHAIIGLPQETPAMMRETAQRLAGARIDGIKLHPLMILRNTQAARLFEKGLIGALTQEEYVGHVCDFLELLAKETVVQRLCGDEAEAQRLIAPAWVRDKTKVLAAIRKEFASRGSFQGSLYREEG